LEAAAGAEKKMPAKALAVGRLEKGFSIGVVAGLRGLVVALFSVLDMMRFLDIRSTEVCRV